MIIVVAIIAILAAVLISLLDPVRRISESRNSSRWLAVKSINEALLALEVDHANNAKLVNLNIEEGLHLLGTSQGNCEMSCGLEEVSNYNPLNNVQGFKLEDKTATEWFDISSLDLENFVTVQLALSCEGQCENDLNIRFGNNDTSEDFLFLRGEDLASFTDSNLKYVWIKKSFYLPKSLLENNFYLQILPSENDVIVFKDANNNYLFKLLFVEKTKRECLDLSNLIEVPVDPLTEDDAVSFYAVKRNELENLVVKSCRAELGQSIRSIR